MKKRSTGLDAGKTSNKTKLEEGVIYDGTISEVFSLSTGVNVVLDQSGLVVQGCKMAVGIFSAMLGFKINFLPTPGTRVKIIYGKPSVVFACIPSDPPDSDAADAFFVRSGLAGTVADLQTFAGVASVDNSGHSRPADLLEGEFDISNAMGVALTMLTTMAKLSAGDRASVSVHMLNDMVRIVSSVFRHFSAFGDMQIYNDGRLNARWDGTSYEHELLGRLNPRDAKADTAGKGVMDFSNLDTVNETGRWRFSQFLGFMGDFIHVFVTDPTAVLGTMASDAFRSGKANLHVGSDGTILFQTVSEIAFERVVRVVVPVEVKRPDDPKGTRNADFDALQSSFLKLWDYGSDFTNISHTAYQLREYARWLSSYHSLARFHQSQAKGGNWVVPPETSIPAPEWTCKEPDKEQANTQLTPRYKDVYATVRIMRDGSIVAMEAGGGAISLVQGCGQVAVPKHLWFEAAGDMHFRSGRNMFFTARRSITISAVAGGLILKARTWLNALCEWGSIYIKSDALDPSKSGYTAKTTGDCTWGDQDPLPIVLEHAVLIESTQGKATILGQKLLAAATGIPADDSDSNGSLALQSNRGKATLLAFNDTDIRSETGNVRIKAAKDLLLSAVKFVSKLTGQLFSINGVFALRGGDLNVRTVKARMVSAIQNIMGPARQAQIDPTDSSPSSMKRHTNHITSLPTDTTPYLPSYATDDDTTDLIAFAGESSTIPAPFSAKHPVWDFEAVPAYDAATDPIFQSLAQQRIATDTSMTASYDVWTWEQNALLQSDANNGNNLPGMPTGSKQLEHAGGSDLFTPTSTNGDGLAAQTKLKPQPITTKFLKS